MSVPKYTTHANSFGPIYRYGRSDAHVLLSHRCRTSGLPRHWTPKMDVEALLRRRRELELIRQLEELGYGFYLC